MGAYTTLVYISAYVGLFVVCFYLLSLKDYIKKKKNFPEKTDKTVSIIIPAWNEEKDIEKTIKSALAIDYPKNKLEIIVVDDGSQDKTYELAKKFESSKKFKVRVFAKKENGGKGSALNFGIGKSKSDIIISMDADTFIEPNVVKLMISRFYSDEVMSVTPAMGIFNPKSIFQRIQQIEYYLGVFLRKVFSTVNAIHVTPGAFSAYRKKFFLKHGGYDEEDITEDLEVALRIQSKGYIIENVPEAVVHTLGPRTFRELLVQRRRWYAGQIKNFWRYRGLFGFKKGVLGMIVLPMAIISVLFSMTLTSYSIIKILIELKKELMFMSSINFQFEGLFELSSYLTSEFLRKFFYSAFSQPVILIGVLFIFITIFYLIFAKSKVKFKGFLVINLILFLLGFSILYSIWWVVSVIYILFNKNVVWRKKNVKTV